MQSAVEHRSAEVGLRHGAVFRVDVSHDPVVKGLTVLAARERGDRPGVDGIWLAIAARVLDLQIAATRQ
jgi:hypothetical protein